MRFPALSASASWLVILTIAAGACSRVGDREGADEGGGQEEATWKESQPVELHTALDSLLGAGERAFEEGEYASAQTAFDSAREMAGGLGDSAEVARALTWSGISARWLGDFETARRHGELALTLKQRLRLRGHEPDLFSSYNSLGLLAWWEGRLFDALELYERAYALAEAEPDAENLAKVASNRALVRMDLGDFSRARRELETALATARTIGDPLIEGRVLDNLATLEVQVGSPVRAVAFLEDARRLSREAGDLTAETYNLGQLGSAYSAIGELGRAIAYIDSAMQLSRSQGLRFEEAANLEQLADVHAEAGRYRHALRLLAEAKGIHGGLGLDLETGIDLRREADIYDLLGDLERARRHASEALERHRRVGAPFEVLADLLLLVDLTHLSDRPHETRRHLDGARRLTMELDTRHARASLALAEARFAMRDRRADDALAFLAAAARDFEGGGFGTEWRAHALRARAHASLGRLDSAAAAGREAVAAVERSRSRFAGAVLRASYGAARVEVYADLVDILLSLDRVEEAFEVADAARGRALLESLPMATERAREPETETPGPAAFAGARERPRSGTGWETLQDLATAEELLIRIDTLVHRIDGIDSLPAAEQTELETEAARLYAELDRARSEYEAVLVRANEENPAGSRLIGAGRAGAGEVRTALGHDEALLEFLLTSKKLFLFVVRPSGAQAFATEIQPERFKSRIRVARELLQSPKVLAPGRSAVLSGLRDLLIGPAISAGTLRGVSRLVIIPHSELNYLPLAALLDDATGRYLAEEYTLLHAPSAAALAAMRTRPRRRPPGESPPPEVRRLEGGAPAAFAPLPEELPATALEAEAFGRIVEGAEVFLGAEATEGRFRETLAGGGVVHAATHGILNAWNPMFSRIELASGPVGTPEDDGRLEVHEVLNSRVRSPLVFLSGCETGRGTVGSTRYVGGEDYATLAQAFLFAGAENVVATLWRVDDEGAGAFAERFFQRLGTSSFAETLALAQRDMIEDPRYASPFYWAGYRLDGRSQ
ncbi:MAG: CHAT domain-containing protein [Gemmatimonadota bacterium]